MSKANPTKQNMKYVMKKTKY